MKVCSDFYDDYTELEKLKRENENLKKLVDYWKKLYIKSRSIAIMYNSSYGKFPNFSTEEIENEI